MQCKGSRQHQKCIMTVIYDSCNHRSLGTDVFTLYLKKNISWPEVFLKGMKNPERMREAYNQHFTFNYCNNKHVLFLFFLYCNLILRT